MISNKKNNVFFQLLTTTGRKVIKQIGWLFLISISLYSVDNYYLKNKCEMTKTSSECFLSPLLGDLGENVFQAAILIWFFEIGLKRETLKEIQDIFISTQPTRHLKGFYLRRDGYKQLIGDSLKDALPGQEIKILCLFEEEIDNFLQKDLKHLRNLVISGCKVRILILHPQSSLLECIESVGLTGKLDHQVQLSAFSRKLNSLAKYLDDYRIDNHIKGTIEVKLHKDLFSAIGYYSDSKDTHIGWMYFSDSDDASKYPAFHIGNQDLINDTENHFEYLWEKAKGEGMFLLRITPEKEKTINNIGKIFLF